jgi:hypothetical protein
MSSNPHVNLGEIVDINDPLKQGRARVRVFGFFDELEIEDIPWAEQISGLSFSSSRGNGNISVPRVGAVVNVQFDGPNYYKCFYEFEKETSPDLLAEIADSYEGAQSLIYDTDAQPGPLKLFYTRQKGLVISLGDATVQLDTQDGGQLRVVIQMGRDQIRMENNKVIVNSNNIELGENAVEAVIKGNTFQAYFNSHTHIGNLGAPTSPPVVPSTPNHLSTVSKTR